MQDIPSPGLIIIIIILFTAGVFTNAYCELLHYVFAVAILFPEVRLNFINYMSDTGFPVLRSHRVNPIMWELQGFCHDKSFSVFCRITFHLCPYQIEFTISNWEAQNRMSCSLSYNISPIHCCLISLGATTHSLAYCHWIVCGVSLGYLPFECW